MHQQRLQVCGKSTTTHLAATKLHDVQYLHRTQSLPAAKKRICSSYLYCCWVINAYFEIQRLFDCIEMDISFGLMLLSVLIFCRRSKQRRYVGWYRGFTAKTNSFQWELPYSFNLKFVSVFMSRACTSNASSSMMLIQVPRQQLGNTNLVTYFYVY